MKQTKRRIVNAIIFITIFAIGITLGKLCNWGYFELSKEISIIEALTLFVTIGLAIYIAKIIEKEVQDIRMEKELYVAKLSEIETILTSFEELVEERNVSYTKINNRIHSCRIKINNLFANLKSNFKKLKSEDVSLVDEKVNERIKILNRLLTETPAVPIETPELSVKDGLANYSSQRIAEICSEITAINDLLFNLKIRINGL
jgi:hypothetical protein